MVLSKRLVTSFFCFPSSRELTKLKTVLEPLQEVSIENTIIPREYLEVYTTENLFLFLIKSSYCSRMNFEKEFLINFFPRVWRIKVSNLTSVRLEIVGL